jgi:hypothetical protein
MPLSDIVDVQVTINSSTVAQQGFGTPLIYAHHTHYPDLVRSYRASDWASAMVADGFTTDEAAYQCAAAMMRQNPRPSTFKVGLRSAPEVQVLRLYVTAAGPTSLTVQDPIGGTTPLSVTGATVADVLTALTAAVNGVAGLALTAAAGGADHITLTADAADRIFSVYGLSPNARLEDHTVAHAGLGDDLTAIRDADNDWYGLVLASSAPTSIASAAAWVEGEMKIFVASTHDQRPLLAPTTDVIATIDGANYARTHVAYNSRAGSFYGAAWLAALLPFEPGQADWKFKTLKGVYTDKLTATQQGHLAGKGGSYYESPIRGLDMTGAAIGGDGVFLDLTQLRDWTVVRIQEAVVSMLASSPKTAFTDEDGGAKIYSALTNVLRQGIRNGAIDDDPDTFRVAVPKRSELDPADRAARRWTGCVLSYRPTGAIHSVGTINVYLNVA